MSDPRDHTRADYRHFLAIPTRWMDNDTYGHVNNVTYYSYFDTVVNEHLVAELKKLDLWEDVMVADLKYFDGSLAKIDRVPAKMRELYATAFEVETKWIVEAGARRQKWIDQAQSLNIYMAGASGKKLDDTYKLAWQRGLKTTYYLRTLAATSAEKSTGKGGELNAVSSGGLAPVSAKPAAAEPEPKMCLINDPTCEACQ